MKTLVRSAVGLAVVSLFAVAHAAPPMVNPEPMDLDPDMTAKILKEKSKRTTTSDASGGAAGGSSANCGTVNINSNEKKSNSGIAGIMGNKSTTIITGPVINMANCPK